jgi:hypothetical protein
MNSDDENHTTVDVLVLVYSSFDEV